MKSIQVADVLARAQKASGANWKKAPEDGIPAGQAGIDVTGVGVAWRPTFDVLRQAVAQRSNLILTKEPMYWSDSIARPEAEVSGPSPTEQIEHTELYLEIKDYVAKHGLVIGRLSGNWDGAQARRLEGLVASFGWEKSKDASASLKLANTQTAIFDLPAMSVLQLAQTVKFASRGEAVRVVGNPTDSVQRVAVRPGYLMVADLMKIVNSGVIDAVVVGEACEWEAYEYIEDWITAGRGKAMVMLGLAVSEDPGARAMADWIRSFVPEAPVNYIHTGDPFTPVKL